MNNARLYGVGGERLLDGEDLIISSLEGCKRRDREVAMLKHIEHSSFPFLLIMLTNNKVIKALNLK